jgi:hypothetical protein
MEKKGREEEKKKENDNRKRQHFGSQKAMDAGD